MSDIATQFRLDKSDIVRHINELVAMIPKQTSKIIKMGDWNTLHHFDDKKFYSKIVTDFKSNGQLIREYFNSDFGKYIAYGNDKNDERIAEILKFSQHLDEDFKSHKTLYNIQTRKKGISEEYSVFIKKRYQDEEDFQKANRQIIEAKSFQAEPLTARFGFYKYHSVVFSYSSSSQLL